MSGNGSKPSTNGGARAGNRLATAVQLLMGGKHQEAIGTLHEVLATEPNNKEALHMLGVIACKAGDHQAGVSLLSRAVDLDPGDAAALYNLGNAYRSLKQNAPAADNYRRALKLAPDNSLACHALADTLVALRQPEEAVKYYEQALSADENDITVGARLAVLYEQHNEESRARELAEKLIAREPDHPVLNLVLARCDKRDDHFDAAIDRLEKVIDSNEDARQDFRLHYELGRLYDKQDQTDAAIQSFHRANTIQRANWSDEDWPGPSSVQYIDMQADAFTADWVATWTQTPPMVVDETPVFLIGFPRSGTTLLDQILDSHPALRVLEEKPAVASMRKYISGLPGGYPAALATLGADDFVELRKIYFGCAESFMEGDRSARLVDKLPLNTTRAGLIYRIFPDAKFIFALRHPHDVILSCYMQDFVVNSAMSNFLDLADAADYYAKSMLLWNRFVELLPLKVHFVRYESLVRDVEAEAREVLKFLELPFDEAVLDFSAHARSRGRINTPSYHQVSQPVYTSAVDRWRKYEGHLEPIIEKLKPFVKQFGYE